MRFFVLWKAWPKYFRFLRFVPLVLSQRLNLIAIMHGPDYDHARGLFLRSALFHTWQLVDEKGNKYPLEPFSVIGNTEGKANPLRQGLALWFRLCFPQTRLCRFLPFRFRFVSRQWPLRNSMATPFTKSGKSRTLATLHWQSRFSRLGRASWFKSLAIASGWIGLMMTVMTNVCWHQTLINVRSIIRKSLAASMETFKMTTLWLHIP